MALPTSALEPLTLGVQAAAVASLAVAITDRHNSSHELSAKKNKEYPARFRPGL
jgi:hypothetical protein